MLRIHIKASFFPAALLPSVPNFGSADLLALIYNPIALPLFPNHDCNWASWNISLSGTLFLLWALFLLVSTVDAKAFTGVGISATCELKILRILQLKCNFSW